MELRLAFIVAVLPLICSHFVAAVPQKSSADASASAAAKANAESNGKTYGRSGKTGFSADSRSTASASAQASARAGAGSVTKSNSDNRLLSLDNIAIKTSGMYSCSVPVLAVPYKPLGSTPVVMDDKQSQRDYHPVDFGLKDLDKKEKLAAVKIDPGQKFRYHVTEKTVHKASNLLEVAKKEQSKDEGEEKTTTTTTTSNSYYVDPQPFKSFDQYSSPSNSTTSGASAEASASAKAGAKTGGSGAGASAKAEAAAKAKAEGGDAGAEAEADAEAEAGAESGSDE